MEEDPLRQASFINATGQKITQLFYPHNFTVSGKVYETSRLDRKNSHSVLFYIKDLMAYVLSAKFKELVSSITQTPRRTLQSVYSGESMVILSNSFDLESALTTAQQYNIPLLQIVILTLEGEQTVKDKILLSFKVSHLINENFVLYGDWEQRPQMWAFLDPVEPAEEGECRREEGIYARMG